MGMRVQPDKDVTIIKGKKGSTLDPSTGHEVATSAMIIDATIPLDRSFQRVAEVPREVMERIRLEDYIPQQLLEGATYPGTIL